MKSRSSFAHDGKDHMIREIINQTRVENSWQTDLQSKILPSETEKREGIYSFFMKKIKRSMVFRGIIVRLYIFVPWITVTFI